MAIPQRYLCVFQSTFKVANTPRDRYLYVTAVDVMDAIDKLHQQLMRESEILNLIVAVIPGKIFGVNLSL